MAGHSKWHNIRHRKGRVDAKRSKIWSKCSKAIMVAARAGGPDPSMNLALRYAIDEARYANMPRDTIERAVKKGSGANDGDSFEEVRYEGYGPGGVAVIVDALTDNRTRTASDVRFLFSKGGGNLGQTGSVAFQFDCKGQIVIDGEGIDGDALMEAAIESGADDVSEPESDELPWVISAEPTEFQGVKDALEQAGFTISEASIMMVPNTTVATAGDDAKKVLTLVDMLEDNEDVQKVYYNAEIPDDEMASME